MMLSCFGQRGTVRRGRVSPKGERFLFGPSVDARWVLTDGQLLLRFGYRMPEAERRSPEWAEQHYLHSDVVQTGTKVL